jgi:spermidine synthase
MFAMGSINLMAGAIFMLVGWRGRHSIALPTAAEGGSGGGFPLYAGIALLIGFSMMAVQTTVIRIGGLAFGGSQFTFSMVVAVFVLCIALGSFGVSALRRIHRVYLPVTVWGLAVLLYLLYLPLQDTPYWAHVLRTLFPDQDGFYSYHAAIFGSFCAVIGVPVALAGATLPLIFHQLRRDVGELGANAGRLYSWNTVGSLLGALLGGYALLFWLDLHHVYRIAVGAVALAAVLLTMRLGGLSRRAAALLFAPAVIALVLLEPWDGKRLSAGLFRVRTPMATTHAGPERFFASLESNFGVVFYEDDPTASIAVKEYHTVKGTRFSRSIVSNGKSDGNTDFDYPTMGLLALLPALFAERAERAFVVGYGTGVTAGELAALESMREVVVAEISTSVMRAAPLFEFANMKTFTSPKLNIVRSDGYRALLRSEGRYDLIVSEPSNPWALGVEMLYSREFLAAARQRLSPRGVFCQWIHEYETDDETLALVLRTYASVFEHVAVWYGTGNDLLLLGFNDASLALDLDRLEARAARFAAGLHRSGVESLAQLLVHEILPLGVLEAASLEGPVHTLDHPRLNHQAGRAFFRGSRGSLPFTGQLEAALVGERNSLLRRYLARFDGELPEDVRAEIVEESCSKRAFQCASLLAEWSNREGNTPAYQEALTEARREHPNAGVLVPEALLRLEGLLGAPQDAGLAMSLARVESVHQLFRRCYLHAQPFDPERLIAFWERCSAPPGRPQACRDGLRRSRAALAGRARFESEDPL